MRIGHGFDAHRFAEDGTEIVIGGAVIPHTRALVAHSDGDVLVHALCDALLGAAGWGDIGLHFPDTDAAFENIDSRVLLRKVVADLSEAGYRVGNVDATLIAQRPRFRPHINTMRERLAKDLKIESACVNIKATTTEKMGYTGRGEGIAAHAVVLLFAA
ncbi:MAG: 2-C-methyl-D-erythritol 2,4-cyclodiphosphate synthase [Gammaproteobacteria bacterium]|nr:2-C-methyl-D-erythritol 2,4-cyclodiphosphate synthase [Gammaproteobacteria bacterium]